MSAPERIYFLTLGCSKNEVDSERMMAAAAADGARLLVDDPGEADTILINTCAFVSAAIEESLGAVFEVLALPRVASGETRVVVAGCLASRYGEELRKELPEVDLFLPCDQELAYFGRGPEAGAAKGEVHAANSMASDADRAAREAKLRLYGRPWAYLKISDGCSRDCAFCSIPAIKGPMVCQSLDAVLQEAAGLVAGGARELVLIAQDSGLWQDGCHDLADLLQALAERFPEVWLRVMYLYPETVSDKLLEVFAAHGNICDYFDLPFQHGDKAVLKAMRRPGDAEKYLALITKVRRELPDAAIRTTLISGFPGETAEQHRHLLAFLRQAEFESGGVFAYSREEGTAAYALHPQHGEAVKRRRQQEANDLLQEIAAGRLAALVGQTVEVLVEGRDEDGFTVRTQQMAPEVDALIHLEGPAASEFELGQFTRVTITDAAGFELFGTPIS